MSDLAYESYREQQREKILEELWSIIPTHYIHDTHEEVVNSVLKYTEENYIDYDRYICPEDIDELVIEYTNSLR